jgi:NADH oxidase (H2O2-forming)
MARKIVIVGAGTAGASAAFAARKQDRNCEITLLSAESVPTYSRCGLPFVIGGEIESFSKIIVFPEKSFKSQNINLRLGTTVRTLDIRNKTIRLTKAEEISFDSLVIATGAIASFPQISGADTLSVFVLRTVEDGSKILACAAPGRKIVINGASYIAVELAEALERKGAEVTLIIRSRPLRGMLDEPVSKMVEQVLIENGIAVIRGKEISAVLGDSRVNAVKVGGETVQADVVIMCTGVEPDVRLAKEAGLAIGEAGGIRVDERLLTSAQDIFAAGDCVEYPHAVSGKPFVSGLGTVATKQGMVAGANAAGGDCSAPPVLGAAVLKLFGVQVGSVGLTEVAAKEAGFTPVSAMTSHPSLPHYYPGAVPVTVRLIADSASNRILGGQVVAPCQAGVAQRINALSVAILKSVTAQELAGADFCYSPPVSDIWAAEAVAAQALIRRIESERRRS